MPVTIWRLLHALSVWVKALSVSKGQTWRCVIQVNGMEVIELVLYNIIIYDLLNLFPFFLFLFSVEFHLENFVLKPIIFEFQFFILFLKIDVFRLFNKILNLTLVQQFEVGDMFILPFDFTFQFFYWIHMLLYFLSLVKNLFVPFLDYLFIFIVFWIYDVD